MSSWLIGVDCAKESQMGVSRQFSFPLWGCLCLMECYRELILGKSWVMPNWVVGLFACWLIGGCFWSVVVWWIYSAFLPYLVLTEGTKRQNFENQERVLEGLKVFFLLFSIYFKSCIFTPFVIRFNEFIILFSSSIWAFSCILYVY